MTEVVVSTGMIRRAKLQSNYHHQQTNSQLFYRPDALPVAKPTVSKHWMEITARYDGGDINKTYKAPVKSPPPI